MVSAMSSTSLYNDRGKFIGHSGEVSHGIGNGRAFCFDSHEWCYPDSPCDLCNRSLMGDPWEIIQRVRDVCADEAFWAESGPDAELVRAVTVEAVFAALDGERDG